MVRVIWMLGVLVFSAKAQTGYTNGLFGLSAVGGHKQTFWSGLAYPASMEKEPWAVGAMGESRFMTDLGFYEFGVRGTVAGQAFQMKISREGNSSVSGTSASVAIGRKLSNQLSLALRLGYVITTSKGYSNEGAATAGLGAFVKLTEKCKWAVQADGINSFFTKNGSTDLLLIRTGLGYSISELVSLTFEIIKEKSHSVNTILALSYQVLDNLKLSLGSSATPGTFIFGVSFQHAGMDLRLSSSYHTALGASTGISLVYYFKIKA